MAVDAAGHHQQAGGVDLARALVELVGDGDDPPVANADVGADTCRRR